MKTKVIVIQSFYKSQEVSSYICRGTDMKRNEVDFYRVFSYDGEEITYYWDDPMPNESLSGIIKRLSTEDNIVKYTNSKVVENLLTQSDYWHHNNCEEDIIKFQLAWNLIK